MRFLTYRFSKPLKHKIMASIFSKIIAGEIPCYKIAETEDYFAFLDISPVQMGHTLVVPKDERDYIFDYEDKYYAGLWTFAKRIAEAQKRAIPCRKIGVAVIGLEVPHAHIHLVPMNNEGDLDFDAKKKLHPTAQQMEEIAEKIRKEL